MGDTSWGGNLGSSMVLEHLCPCALHGNKVSADPFLLLELWPCCFFVVLPWKCCLHPSLALPVSILPWSCLHPSLVLQPVSATRLLPRGSQGVPPSLPTLHKALQRDGKGDRGEEVAPPGHSLCPCLGAGKVDHGSPKSRTAEILCVAGGEHGKSWGGGDSDIPVTTSSQP